MRISRGASFGFAAIMAAVVWCGCPAEGRTHGPFNLYLTYPGDPATTVAVGYQTSGTNDKSVVHYDVAPRDGKRRKYAFESTGTTDTLPGLPVERTFHSVVLTGLQPDTTYYFIAGSRRTGFSEERSFRTLPESGPIRFVAGGDQNVTPLAARLMRETAKHDPAFVIMGGDIAYANGRPENYRRWDRWFEQWDDNLRGADGRMVPVVAAIGNHETNDSESDDPRVLAPFFTRFFHAQAESTYFTRVFAGHTALIVLDSAHVTPHAEQVEWLEGQLDAYDGLPNLIATYHVPLYPSHREYTDSRSVAGRTHWGPLFDRYGLDLGLENHDHTYKRSKPLVASEANEDGTVYLGDGSYGVPPRTVELRPYLERTESRPHFWVIDADDEGLRCRAVDEHGAVFDEVSVAAEAAAVP